MATKQMNNSRSSTIQKMETFKKKNQTNSHEQVAKQMKEPLTLSHEQIAERAKSIWQGRGCPANEDMKNWLEAENQLKTELSAR